MIETPQVIGGIRAMMSAYKQRKERAFSIAKSAFDICERPYLALSGGKDAVATLAVVNEVANKVNREFVIWAHISDASFPGTRQVIEECAQISGRQLFLDESPVSAFDVIKDNISPFGKSGYFFDSIKQFVATYKADLTFLGVRAGESNRRGRALKFKGHLFQSKTAGERWICYPVAWMNVDDVFALAVEYGYPIHPIYTKNHPDGVRAIRLGYVTSQDLMNLGTVTFIRDNYPDIYNKLVSSSERYSWYA